MTATAPHTAPDRTAETFRQTVARLAGAQKARAAGAPAYSIYVNRPIGRYLAATSYRAGLTPNAVTGISALFTFSALLLVALAPPSWWTGPVVAAGLVLGYAFDSADGQVARLRGGGSLVGEWLDHVVDSAKISSLHLVVVVAAYRFWDLPTTPGLPDDIWLLVPLLYCVVAAVGFFTMILNDQLKASHARRTGVVGTRRQGGRLRSLLLLPTDYGVLCLAFLAIGVPPVFLVLYTLLFLAQAGHLALALVSWARQLGALDREAMSR